jgi:hypothetical protein
LVAGVRAQYFLTFDEGQLQTSYLSTMTSLEPHPQGYMIELLEKVAAARTNVQDLPTELIEQIATHLDNTTLIALKSASLTLRSRTYHVFGLRLLRTISVAMNPIGLHALQEIAYNPDLAKHVRILHFS